MLNILIRAAIAIVGLALLLDAVLPVSQETAFVDAHKSATTQRQEGQWYRTETTYRLRFHGARIGSCDVGLSAFSSVSDGDSVTVRYSKIFKNCTRIQKGESTSYEHRSWRLFYALAGVFFLLGAAGAFPSFQIMGRELK